MDPSFVTPFGKKQADRIKTGKNRIKLVKTGSNH
jgi:hypothetical protein